ncbi:uncharacterized protein [Rutidosis leptorrhynchoides]|uniref:uncharacterized protein n=1 Tax=Rutidosis leptorrhynchoides TaxID=125765 RepID=UPI003A9989D3
MVNRQKIMDSSSKLYGDHEECHSSESGWTMYIGSSMDDDGDDDNDVGGVYDDGGGRKKGIMKNDDDDDGDDDDTDDSMASDASSGPSHLHLQQPWDVQQNHDPKNNNQEKLKGSSKKNKKGKKKGGYDGQDQSRKKDENLVNEKRGVITTVQSGNRAWFLGKRK